MIVDKIDRLLKLNASLNNLSVESKDYREVLFNTELELSSMGYKTNVSLESYTLAPLLAKSVIAGAASGALVSSFRDYFSVLASKALRVLTLVPGKIVKYSPAIVASKHLLSLSGGKSTVSQKPIPIDVINWWAIGEIYRASIPEREGDKDNICRVYENITGLHSSLYLDENKFKDRSYTFPIIKSEEVTLSSLLDIEWYGMNKVDVIKYGILAKGKIESRVKLLQPVNKTANINYLKDLISKSSSYSDDIGKMVKEKLKNCTSFVSMLNKRSSVPISIYRYLLEETGSDSFGVSDKTLEILLCNGNDKLIKELNKSMEILFYSYGEILESLILFLKIINRDFR